MGESNLVAEAEYGALANFCYCLRKFLHYHCASTRMQCLRELLETLHAVFDAVDSRSDGRGEGE